MKIYYVTGVSGTGKTAVSIELSRRGYIALDADNHGISGWQEKESGKFIDGSDRVAGPTGSLVELYEWNMSATRLGELAAEASAEMMFVCGASSNRYELWSMFEKVFCLQIDEATLVHRLTTRTNNDFGKDPKDLQEILGWHQFADEADIAAGAIPIDGTAPIDVVADSILERI